MNCSPRFLAAGAVALWVAGNCAALADVKMPAIFGDHMVLQDGLPVPVWGTADPGEAVTVTLSAHSANATAGSDGKWMAKLPAMDASAQGAAMTVAGKNTLTFQDVLIGEVWVCSGQSNMEFPMTRAHNAGTEIPKANDPQIRLFLVARQEAHAPASDVVGKWVVCAPDSVTNFSAVGYFFGRELREKLGKPVGLIGTYWGGTPAEAWTSLDGLKKEPALAHYVQTWEGIDAGYAKAKADYPAAQGAYTTAMADWTAKYGKDYTVAMAKWRGDVTRALLANQPPPTRPPAPPVAAPRKPADPVGGPSAPASLYDGMIAPIQPYAIRGTIWYQGEANAPRAVEYRTLFPRMIKDWRDTWAEGDFPFLFVQLAGFRPAVGEDWPELRDAQMATLLLPATGMATAVDIGLPGNIHPMDKMDVGQRLALAARHVAYGEDLVYSGPMFEGVKKDGSGLRVEFQDIGGGLEIGKAPWVGPGSLTAPTDRLAGFEVAGADGAWKPADAKIDGDAVVVSSADVPAPVEVRYDWRAYPGGNLYNKVALPALPFHAKAE
jgi:sialate O-acetylesterase